MYKVITVTPSVLQVEIIDVAAYHAQTDDLKLSIGSYLKISDDNGLSIIAIVQSFRIRDSVSPASDAEAGSPNFVVEAQQVGCFDGERFKRGGQQIAIPPTDVQVVTADELRQIYAGVPPEKRFEFGVLDQSQTVRVAVDGDRFFSKHIAVVGSTGSGKSCTVAKLLQEGVSKSADQSTRGVLNNSHIVIFDLHGEYAPAFPSANLIDVENLVLPYWLMNSEELEEMFLDGHEQNFHNQASQFKHAVTENKKKYNDTIAKVDYDTPVYFSILEVCRFINNQNLATKDANTNVLAIEQIPEGVDPKHILFEKIKFKEKKRSEINDGPYAGEFDRFCSRLDTKLADDRLRFLIDPKKGEAPYVTADLGTIVRQFTGYAETGTANVTVINLSGVPFEVLSVVVSLITRLIFDFCFHFKRSATAGSELPFLLVYEEAHNYIPQSSGSRYGSVKKSIERVAKEGRKYGLSLMIVSQRPSEISETIMSQCNNFVAMRLTNPTDQQYVKRLLPDSVNAITDRLPVLERQEAIVIGDSIAVPSVVVVDEITDKPRSSDIDFRTEWQKDWYDLAVADIIKKMTKEP